MMNERQLGLLPAQGLYFQHVNRLEMSHVKVQPKAPDARPATSTDDVHRADVSFITAPSVPSAFSFQRSSNLRILLSRAAPDLILP
jgi:hypothetical protein